MTLKRVRAEGSKAQEGPPEWFRVAVCKSIGAAVSDGTVLGLWRDEMEGELARAGYEAGRAETEAEREE